MDPQGSPVTDAEISLQGRPVLNDTNLLEMQQPFHVTLDYPSPKSMNYLTGTIRWIGEPLKQGIRISGYCAELKHHTSYHLEPGKTDFKIGPVPSGTYRIRADHPALETLNLRKIKNLNDLDHVKIPNEQPLQLALRVRGKPHLQGTVVDAETQKPLPSFRYRITKLRTLSGPNYVQDDQWRLGKSGKFRADVVGPGVYSVSVLAEDYAIQTGPEINTNEQPDEILGFLMRPGLRLEGSVVDEAGKPVAGATVRALSLTSGAMPRVRSRFVTMEGAVATENGRFVLENLSPGTESLRVDHPEYAFKVVEGIKVDTGTEPLTIVLSEGATIRGTVFDSNGNLSQTKHCFSRTTMRTGEATGKPAPLAQRSRTSTGDMKSITCRKRLFTSIVPTSGLRPEWFARQYSPQTAKHTSSI